MQALSEEYEIEKANRSKVESRIAPKPSAGPKKPSKSSKVTKSAPTTSSKAKRKEPSKPAFNPEAEMKKLLDKENELDELLSNFQDNDIWSSRI